MALDTITLVDDDTSFTMMLGMQLEDLGFNTESFHSPEVIMAHLNEGSQPEVILLDYHFGTDKINGLELCTNIKSSIDVPVIMLSCDDDRDTLVSCLDAGADQYIVKPCDVNELIARINAVTRLYHRVQTAEPPADPESQQAAGIEMNRTDRTLSAQGYSVQLTQKEYDAIELLAKHLGEVIDREQFYQHLYGIEYDPMSRAIDMLLARLRKKVHAQDLGIHLQACRNRGYRLVKGLS